MGHRNAVLGGLTLVLVARVGLAETVIRFMSEPGDYIGGGRDFELTTADGTFSAGFITGGGVDIQFNGTTFWSLQFVGPQASRFIAGPYEGATRYPFNSPRKPGLSVSGDGRGCNTLTGRFDVLEIEIGTGGEVNRFAAQFEQHCEGGGPALFGTVLFNASGPPFPPPPDTDGDGLPDTVDNCPGAANAGQEDTDLDRLGDACDDEFNHTKITFESEPGDYIGGGRSFTLTPADGEFRARVISGGIEIDFNGDDSWSLEFVGPQASRFIPGPYEEATRYPFNSPRKPGLSVSGAGRGCNTLTGRFDVLEIEIGTGGEVKRFAAQFEQHCEGGRPALLGTVFFNASGPPFPPPSDTDSDGLPDTVDNCPGAANAGQEDADLDRIGDACDDEFNNTKITFESEPGDFIGGGRSFTLALADGEIRARVIPGGIEIDFNGDDSWTLDFVGPQASRFIPGPYEEATRYPFNSPRKPGLSVSGAGRGCNTLTGRFDVLEIEIGTGGEVKRFAAQFEQHCEEGRPALLGTVFFNASGPPFPAPPDTDGDELPDTVDNCPGAANTGQEDADLDGLGDACDEEFNNTVVFLDSQSGDYVGAGRQWLLTPDDGSLQVSGTDAGVTISFTGPGSWHLTFAPAEGQKLAAGAFEGATRSPFNDPGEPGLSVFGDGRGCNTLLGRFEVLEIAFEANGEVERFAAEFEQHCEGGVAALFGSVRYNSRLEGQFRDCNRNHFLDARDIAEHFSIDRDHDGIPDECQSSPFVRADANADGTTNITDVLYVLNFLFRRGPDIPCVKSADTNDDGRLNVIDAIVALFFLFEGETIPGPLDSCGSDPSTDFLSCEAFPACANI